MGEDRDYGDAYDYYRLKDKNRYLDSILGKYKTPSIRTYKVDDPKRKEEEKRILKLIGCKR